MKHMWTETMSGRLTVNKRVTERRSITVPARLTWKDQRGATRFASVVTRNISDFGVFVECHTAVSIPLYRLVQFQLEQPSAHADQIPSTLKMGRVLSAVYRVSPPSQSGARQCLALRLMVDPKRYAAELPQARATA